MSKILKVGVIAALLVFAAVFFILKSSQGTMRVVVASRTIDAGTKITSEMLETKNIAVSAIIPGAIKNPQEAIGKTLQIGRAQGDQISSSILASNNNALGPDEVYMDIIVPSEDSIILNPGDKINIIMYGNTNNAETKAINDVKIAEIHQSTSAVNGSSTTVATIIANKRDAEELTPYIKSGNFKIVKE
ncbi:MULTISPECIES: SAF domain-containing protein [Thermoanaerobacterium]|uniref:SAF domain-containing protein n=2 Tax=Thermoanaerobacterium TaxID=28895 RepID=W9E9Y0_9THEO|nr:MULTISPECIES: SAF domain-containing protein [Thermoanaerobacterium]AFK85898.1 SAF domain protein [Thermoanaerobacterium saccharolyticum JW/SL-YS485]ETO38762.1 SAF domain-containing protein [Thermoanaerobacterium aotearoense SCUT27]